MERADLVHGFREERQVVAIHGRDQRSAPTRHECEQLAFVAIRDHGRNRPEHLDLVNGARILRVADL